MKLGSFVMRPLAVFALLLFASSRLQAEDALARLRALETPGASVYSKDAVQKIVRLRPGDPLRRDAAAVALTLETRYQDDGYPAAHVTGAFDTASGTLTLSVDEGRLFEVVVEGTSADAASRALANANLKPGSVLRSADILDAFDRLEHASDFALEAGEYRLETTPAGVRLVLMPRKSRARLEYRFGGTRTSRRYNRVDGLNLQLGADLMLFDHGAFNHLTPYVVGAYGLASKHVRYAAGVSRPFGAGQRTTLGYEYHDLTDSDDLFRAAGLEEAPGTPVTFSSRGDYFGRRGHEAYAFTRLTSRAQLGLAFRSDDYTSLPVSVDDPDARPNPAIDAGRVSSVIATLRFDVSGPLFDAPRRERHSFLQRSLYGHYYEPPRLLRAEATLEIASRDSLGGDFTFRRFIGNLRGRIGLPGRQRLDARALLGLTSGEPPAQKQFALGGLGTLRGYDLKLFPGRNIALATLEWSVAPRTLLPRLIVFYDGGLAWQRELDGPQWKSDLGLGLRFPADGGVFLRLDLARALSDAREKRVRTLFKLQIPI